MTLAEEARFIALWNAGTETAAIAQALGIPVGTVSSRAHVLQLQGKIQPRPRGGPHARRVAQARQEHPPAPPAPQVPPATPAAERKDIQQWTVRLSKALIEHGVPVVLEQKASILSNGLILLIL